VLAVLSWPTLQRIPLGGAAAISPHGIGIAVGFVLAAWLFARLGARRGLRTDDVEVDPAEVASEVVVRAAIGAVVVGRLAFVVTHLDRYTGSLADVVSILAVHDGGLSFLGGVTGALLVCVPWIRRQGLSTPHVLDAAAPAVALGLVLGRVGDLVIGDHVGGPAGDFPLGWRCTARLYDAGSNTLARRPAEPYPIGAAEPPTQGCYDVALHQTALYDGLAALVVLVVLLVLARRTLFPGALAAGSVLVYAPLRVAGDVLREDRRFLALTGSQWTLLLAAVAVTVWLVRRDRREVRS
jgi:prolipoprotein diacylglyceryltransferase